MHGIEEGKNTAVENVCLNTNNQKEKSKTVNSGKEEDTGMLGKETKTHRTYECPKYGCPDCCSCKIAWICRNCQLKLYGKHIGYW